MQYPGMSSYILACTEISKEIISAHQSKQKYNISSTTFKISKKHKLESVPRLTDILKVTPSSFHSLFTTKPVRTASGVAIVAVMSKPHRCPHIALTGNICVYCPGGPDSSFEYSSQSYTGYEPTSMRAIRHRYDPLQQSKTRIQQLKSLGHSTDKIEFIIMGGTFLSLPASYRNDFVKSLYDSLSGNKSYSLENAIAVAEHSATKCVAITIETRPDYCLRPHVSAMLSYGCTRVEIGVQSVYEDVAVDTNRGHSVMAVKQSFCIAKDAGYKIVTHLMPNLPNVDYDRDIFQFFCVFSDPSFRPDGLKIYPTMVVKGTGLYELYKQNKYKPYSVNELINLLSTVLSMVPPWIRIYRVQRDIPMPLITAGVEHANIREIALNKLKELKKRCRDVRSREVGMKKIHEGVEPVDIRLVRRDYIANNGWESFLSYEDLCLDVLIALLRLRKCGGDTYRKELECFGEENDIRNKADLKIGVDKVNIENNRLEKQEDNNRVKADFNEINIENSIKNSRLEKQENNNRREVIKEECCKENNIVNEDDINSKNRMEENNIKPNPFQPRRLKNEKFENGNVSIIRELHVYGTAVGVSQRDNKKYQHKGYGSMLIAEAERIAKEEHKSKKIAIISGVGTRNYYKKFGYFLEGPYMVKWL